MAQASRTTRSNHLLNLKIHICVLLSFLLIQTTCPIQELSQASSAKGFQTWKRLASSPNVMITSKNHMQNKQYGLQNCIRVKVIVDYQK